MRQFFLSFQGEQLHVIIQVITQVYRAKTCLQVKDAS